MATIKWAVTTDGTFDFNDPNNWVFGTVPGIFDVAQFNTGATDTVTGNAMLAEVLITQGNVTLTGSYTMSGAQPTELAINNANLVVAAGASISGSGIMSTNSNITVTNGSLQVNGTLSGGSATFTSAALSLGAGSVFDVGLLNFGNGDVVTRTGTGGGFSVDTNPIQIAGSVSNTGTELRVSGTISGTGELLVTGAVELDGNNSAYTGDITVSGPLGLLAVGNANALGTGTLTISGLDGTELLVMTSAAISNRLVMGPDSFTIAAAHGQTFTTSITQPWSLEAQGQTVSFGAPGQDGTVAWSTPAGSQVVFGGNGYTLLVRAGTLRANDSSFGLLLSDAHTTAIRPAGTLDVAGFSMTVHNLQGGGHVADSGGHLIVPVTLTVDGGNFGGVIGGPMSVEVSNALTLFGNNTFTGGTTIDSGVTLTLGAGGAAGSSALGFGRWSGKGRRRLAERSGCFISDPFHCGSSFPTLKKSSALPGHTTRRWRITRRARLAHHKG